MQKVRETRPHQVKIPVSVIVDQRFSIHLHAYVIPGQCVDDYFERRIIARAAKQAVQAGKIALANDILKHGRVVYDCATVEKGLVKFPV